MKVFFTTLFFFSFLVTFSQHGLAAKNKSEKERLPIEGTYQLQVINSRGNPYIPGNIDEIVRENRKENEPVYITLGTMVRLKILPLSEIRKPDFKEIEKIAYVSE